MNAEDLAKRHAAIAGDLPDVPLGELTPEQFARLQAAFDDAHVEVAERLKQEASSESHN